MSKKLVNAALWQHCVQIRKEQQEPVKAASKAIKKDIKLSLVAKLKEVMDDF